MNALIRVLQFKIAATVLLGHGLTGAWSGWGVAVQGLLWASALATAAISVGLYRYGIAKAEPAN